VTDDGTTQTWGRLAPVSQRWPWIASGLLLQVVGVGAPVAYVVSKAHHEDVGGHISRATLQLAWRQAVHSHAGLAALIAGAAVFVAGSIVLARPFVKSWVTLFVAIPIAALAGVLVLGAAAIVVALLVVGAEELLEFPGSSSVADAVVDPSFRDSGSDYSRRRRQQQQQEPPEQGPLAGDGSE
jgi:hypothetical protein